MADEVTSRLDKLIAILQLAFREPIERAREALREDPINEAILTRAADEWVPVGALIDRVKQDTEGSTRSVQRRLSELTSIGALERQRSGSAVSYRSAGLL